MDGNKAKIEALMYFCTSCSAKLMAEAHFCWSCGANQKLVGRPSVTTPVNDISTLVSTPSISASTSFGRPLSAKGKSLTEFKAIKTVQRSQGSDFRKAKKAKVSTSEPVTIQVGLKKLNGTSLKTAWGKKLPIQVPRNASYHLILEKGLAKLKAYYSREVGLCSEDSSFVLCYEDGSQAQFLPGTSDFFELQSYKEALGKDYKRLTLYVCNEHDFNNAEKYFLYGESSESDDSNSDIDKNDKNDYECDVAEEFDTESSSSNITHLACEVNSVTSTMTNPGSSITTASSVAHTLTTSSSRTSVTGSTPEVTVNNDSAPSENDLQPSLMPETVEDIYNHIRAKVDQDGDTFFLVSRRMAPISRTLALWQRQAKKTAVTRSVQVHYSGEDGIDSGAIAKEFFQTTIDEIGQNIFPNGSPRDLTFHVQNGDFRASGEIVAASLAQGGPAPEFLDKCAYECMFKEIKDFENIEDGDLTRREKEIISEIQMDPEKMSDLIYENGFRGTISKQNTEAILRSVKVSFITRRIVYMKQFLKGLDSYGLGDMIQQNPELCEQLFVIGSATQVLPDANYLFSLMTPNYSTGGSSSRAIEVEMMDHLQDVLISIEDAEIKSICEAPVAWRSAAMETDEEGDEDTAKEKFGVANMSIAGVMGWLTGQQHRHVLQKDKPYICIKFDHDCLLRNPKHTICFPLVGACGRDVTFPSAHMDTLQKFREVFLLAYCNGQAFGRR